MKNISVLLSVILMVLVSFSCATNSGSSKKSQLSQDELNVLFNDAYDKNQSAVILDGAQTYVVVEGDTMNKISTKFYGSNYEYIFPMIMQASRNVVVDPLLIEPGMRLTIPDFSINIDPTNRMEIALLVGRFASIYEKKGDQKSYGQFMSLAMSLAAY